MSCVSLPGEKLVGYWGSLRLALPSLPLVLRIGKSETCHHEPALRCQGCATNDSSSRQQQQPAGSKTLIAGSRTGDEHRAVLLRVSFHEGFHANFRVLLWCRLSRV